MYLFFSQVIILNLLPPLLLPTGGEMSNLGSEIQKRKMPLLALLSLSLSLAPLLKPAFPGMHAFWPLCFPTVSLAGVITGIEQLYQ